MAAFTRRTIRKRLADKKGIRKKRVTDWKMGKKGFYIGFTSVFGFLNVNKYSSHNFIHTKQLK